MCTSTVAYIAHIGFGLLCVCSQFAKFYCVNTNELLSFPLHPGSTSLSVSTPVRNLLPLVAMETKISVENQMVMTSDGRVLNGTECVAETINLQVSKTAIGVYLFVCLFVFITLCMARHESVLAECCALSFL